MEFGNPIVGQEDLIRSAIKSPDFNTDPESGNVTGWRIARDGSATFYNLTIGSTSFNIDQQGNAVFNDVTVNGELFVNGESVADQLMNMARGLLAMNTLSTSGTYDGTNDLLVGRIIVPGFTVDRAIKVGWFGRVDMGATAPATAYVDHKMYYKWDAPASDADTQFTDFQVVRRNPSSASDSNYDVGINMQMPLQIATQGGTDLHIAAYLNGNVAGFQLQNTVNPRMWVEDIGPVVVVGAWVGSGGGGNPPQQYVKTYAANESASFQEDGTNRNISDLYQGRYSSTNGNQYSMIGFDDATIRSNLSGATINKVELYLNNNHFYSNSGGNAIIGTHNQTTLSGSHSSSQINDNLQQTHFDYGQAKWITIPNSIGNALRDNTAKGIALGPGPSTSQSYYGYFAGNGQSGEPQLRITYTK
ncbi:hypothetical protein SEA_WHEEHEIM_35 [Streptomyces phage WheeHeim]|uniref:Minor tail protein n=1 Tax=Streptomyces phage WheeHeim TaxID=2500797 RepID=A0A411AXW1_9VIRU|nr:tail protein [Streptomyces phage WheeHeim]QAX92943.1 hypothetical protein SEA_WHEEHEIM_35 [Streptomyces phage WheeHeim]